MTRRSASSEELTALPPPYPLLLHMPALRTVTHLVVGVDGHMRVRVRTLKYLTAVVRGCWVVSGKWLQACLAAGRMVPEEPYEVKVGPRLCSPSLLPYSDYALFCAWSVGASSLRFVRNAMGSPIWWCITVTGIKLLR